MSPSTCTHSDQHGADQAAAIAAGSDGLAGADRSRGTQAGQGGGGGQGIAEFTVI